MYWWNGCFKTWFVFCNNNKKGCLLLATFFLDWYFDLEFKSQLCEVRCSHLTEV